MKIRGVRFLCKGLCERYNFGKRPDYDKGDMYCRNCEIVITRLAYETLPQINPDLKYCFCCHRRIACCRRGQKGDWTQNKKQYEYMGTFKELGLNGLKKEMVNSINNKLKKQQEINGLTHNPCCIINRKSYEKHRIRDRKEYYRNYETQRRGKI